MCICASEHEATDYPVKNNIQTWQQYSTLQQSTDSKGNMTTRLRVHKMLFRIRDQECLAVRPRDAFPEADQRSSWLQNRVLLDTVKRLTALGLPYFYSGHARWGVCMYVPSLSVCRITSLLWIRKKRAQTRSTIHTHHAVNLYLWGGKVCTATPESTLFQTLYYILNWATRGTKSSEQRKKKSSFITVVIRILFSLKTPRIPSRFNL